MRRLGTAQLHQGPSRREGRDAQPKPRRVLRDRRRQGGRGGSVPGGRLVRRHRRSRCQGRGRAGNLSINHTRGSLLFRWRETSSSVYPFFTPLVNRFCCVMRIQIKGPSWRVKTGRRDGRVSSASEAVANLPSSFGEIGELKAIFARKGLSAKDLAALSGRSVVGRFFLPRQSPSSGGRSAGFKRCSF